MSRSELDEERSYVGRAWEVAGAVLSGLSEPVQAADQKSASDIREQRLKRADDIRAALDSSEPFVSGRVDVLESDVVEAIYIGRCHVSDPATRDVLVSSWRAEIAGLFFGSAPGHPADPTVARKRTFTGSRSILEGLDDFVYRADLLSRPPAPAPPSPPGPKPETIRSGASPTRRGRRPRKRRLGRGGTRDEPAPELRAAAADSSAGTGREQPQSPAPEPVVAGSSRTREEQPGDPLLVELARSSGPEMRDIIRTIQADQYRLMTAPISKNLIVQGGPGTGKTAVGLHRVALQMFRHREALQPGQVLVVGPSETFLRYVASVLPSLGEGGVNHVVLDHMGPRLSGARRHDSPRVARLKGDVRMARVIESFLDGRISEPTEDLEFEDGLVLPLEEARQSLAEARERPHYRDGRETLRKRWTDALVRRTMLTHRAVLDLLGPEFERALDRTWPTLSAQEGISSLLSGSRILTAAAAGVLASDEVALLLRPRVDRLEDVPWTLDDGPLVDELESRLSGPPGASYAHVLVDEGQSVTPMQWRLLKRRAPRGTFTILGDLAQAEAPANSWTEAFAGTGLDSPVVETMTTGYRVEDAILRWANRLLWAMNVDLPHPRSVRQGGDGPDIRSVNDRSALSREAVAVLAGLDPERRRVGIIAEDDALRAVAALLDAEGVANTLVGREEDSGIVLSTPLEARGLEFDELLVVEPADIVAARGLSSLYVCLTRTRGSLTVIHCAPLPPILRPERLDNPADAQHPPMPEHTTDLSAEDDSAVDEVNEWPQHTPAKLASLTQNYPDVMRRYPRAWASWNAAEDEALARGFEASSSLNDLAERHGRKPAAIRTRLQRLGLL